MSNYQPQTELRVDSSTASEGKTLSSDPGKAPPVLPTIPGYEVVQQLGAGGMGAVFEVVNRLGRHFALKVIRPDRPDPELLLRFRQEAGILQDLDHPHIARIFEYNEVSGYPYYTMRLLTGGTLGEKLRQGPIPLRLGVELLATITEAVGFLHRRGLLHRDLKPSNILFDDEGRPIVTDFGLVKQLTLPPGETEVVLTSDPPADALTGAGRLLGTVRYMGPEQIRGEHDRIGPATDVWALGVILYEVLTGKRPFEDTHFEAIKAKIERAAPIRPTELRAEVCDQLEVIVLKCLSEDPDKRYRTAEELAAALRQWLAEGTPKPRKLTRRWPKYAAAFLGLVLLLAWALSLFKTPGKPLAIFGEKLKRGETVELLGQKGPPLFSEIVCSPPGTINHFVEADGVFTIETRSNLVLVELVPPQLCPKQGYRLKGQVRWNDGTTLEGLSGFYVCRTVALHRGMPNQFFANLGFVDDAGNDIPGVTTAPGQRTGNYAFTLRRWEDVPGQPRNYPKIQFEGLNQYYPNRPPVDDQPAVWRDLEIEVRPEGIACSWQGEAAKELSATTIARHQPLVFGLKDPPMILPLGGIGLQVYEASVSFRSVSITPLAPR
jgi:serine/threonine-protein kinase